MQAKHLWQGEWVSDAKMRENLDTITSFIEPVLGKAFPLEYFLQTSQ